MVENKWMIVKKEKITTKIKNYFKNIFSKLLNNSKKKNKKGKTVKSEKANTIQEKANNYDTIATKAKLSEGTIAVEDVDAKELDPLIDSYRDSNKKLRNRIISSQQ